MLGHEELYNNRNTKKTTNDVECCACCVFNGDDVETGIEEQSGGLSSETVRVLCLPRTMSEILLSNTSMVAGTFYQQKHIIIIFHVSIDTIV